MSSSLLKALDPWHSPSRDQGGRRKQQSAPRMISQGDGADKDRAVSWRARGESISRKREWWFVRDAADGLHKMKSEAMLMKMCWKGEQRKGVAALRKSGIKRTFFAFIFLEVALGTCLYADGSWELLGKCLWVGSKDGMFIGHELIPTLVGDWWVASRGWVNVVGV